MTGVNASRRIAIIGAGGAGACTALELASRGFTVDLFERTDEPLAQASYVHEGKIHLGFIYAKDSSLRTAEWMIRGALQFADNLRRWIPFEVDDAVSTPFLYCVHRGSLMEPDELAWHYRRVEELYNQLAHKTNLDYLDLGSGCRFKEMTEPDYADDLNPDYIKAAFSTTERAVDPRAIAKLLREAISGEPRVKLHSNHEVIAVREGRAGDLWLKIAHDGIVKEECFSDVLNTSWYARLPLDRQMGIVPPAAWSHRYKFGHRISIPLSQKKIPSCTCVQGPFGDIVNFGERGLFMSWYPVGRIGISTEESPPNWDKDLERSDRMDIYTRSFAAWRGLCPALGDLVIKDNDVHPDGGVIYALGEKDIDDGESGLHNRYTIGIQSRGRYHTLDTGKFTLVPYWGVQAADRVEGVVR